MEELLPSLEEDGLKSQSGLYTSHQQVPSKNFPQPAMNRVSPVYNVDIKTGLLIPFVIICQAVKIMLFWKGINTCIHYGMHSVDRK